MQNKKIVFVVASQGYNSVEYGVPKKLLQEHGYIVITSSDTDVRAHAQDGSSTNVDIPLNKLNITDFDGLVFIGGPGALKHLDNDLSYSVIQKANRAGMMIAGICSATRILAKAGALITREATGWNEDGALPEVLDAHGALFSDDEVVTDHVMVTAKGPEQAEEFAHHIMGVV